MSYSDHPTCRIVSKSPTITVFKTISCICFSKSSLNAYLSFISLTVEYMSGGSVYDYLHKQKGSFKLPTLLKVAIDVAKGMNYLHQNNIIHRDLKAANLLMDENEVRRNFQ